MELNLAYYDFKSGVIIRKVRARSDLALVKSGVLIGQNYIPQIQGPQEFRGGFEYYLPSRLNAPSFLLPFIFSDAEAYTLAFSNGYLRFFTTDGVLTESAKDITDITQAATGVVTVTGHGYTNGDEVYIDDIVGMTELNGKFYRVRYISANTFSLVDIDGNSIDTSGYTAYSSGGTSARIYEIVSPYSEAEMRNIQLDGRNDLRYLTNPNHVPYKLVRSGATNWALGVYTRSDDPFEMFEISAITNANPGVVTTSAAHGYANGDLIYIENCSGMTEVNNRIFTIANAAGTTFDLGISTLGYGVYTSGGVCIKDGNQPRAVGVYGGRLFMGGSRNNPDILEGSKSPDSATGAPQYEDFTVGANPEDAVTFALSSLGKSADIIQFFIGTRNFLAVGTYGGMIKVNGGTDSKAIAGDAIQSYPIDAIGVSPVIPAAFGSDILYLQRGAERVLSFQYSLMEDSFTSMDEMIQSDEISYGGVNQLVHQQGTPNLVWAVKNDGTLLSLTYKRSEDISAWTTHKIGGDGEVISIAALNQPDNQDVLWACVKRTVNGKVRYYMERSAKNPRIPEWDDYYSGEEESDRQKYLDLLFESQKRQIHCDCALTLDTTQTTTITPAALSGSGVLFTAGAPIFSATDLGRFIRVKYLVGGEKGIARISEYVSTTQVKCTILQNFLSIDPLASGAWYFTKDTVAGLDHLEGETVTVISDGGPEPDRVVTNGSITLDDQATFVIVGLRYTGRIKTVQLELAFSGGVTNGQLKSVNKIKPYFRNTLGVSYGYNPYDMKRIAFLKGSDISGRPAPLFSGYKDLPGFDRFDIEKTFNFIQDQALPCTILGMVADVEVQFAQS